MNTSGLLAFKEHDFITRIIDMNNPREILQYQELRYELKVKKFKWVTAPSPNRRLDYDKYDSHSVHFGVFNSNGVLVACSRLILPAMGQRLQIIDEFGDLLNPEEKRNLQLDNSVEVSTVLVSDDYKRRNGSKYHMTQMLYKIMGQWCIAKKRRFWHAITNKKILRAFKFQGFPFRIIGGSKFYQGEVLYPAAVDLEMCYEGLLRIDSSVYQWYLEGLDFKGKGDPPKIL